MIFTLYVRYLNCPHCFRKFPAANTCPYCNLEYPFKQAELIIDFVARCRLRSAEGFHQDGIYWTKFYPNYGAFHHIYAIPFLTLEEVLVAENVMYEQHSADEWIASYRFADQPPDIKSMNLLSWQPLLWDTSKEAFYVGDDEGPRTVPYTNYE